MNRKFASCLFGALAVVMLSATNGFSFGSLGSSLNTQCAPETPYTGDCSLCHVADTATSTPAKTAFLAGGATLTNFFCPAPVLTCTDSDGDGFAVEGGDCGQVDCNDANAAVNPGATESCTDGVDNNCDGLVDAMDPLAVACPANCTDADADGYAIEGGACGPVDCNDSDPAVNPAAVEVCDNNVDNDCDGLVNEQCNLSCPADARLVVREITWDHANKRMLTIKGRTVVRGGTPVGTTITILDADTGEVLEAPFEVTKTNGVWKARIKHVSRDVRHISIVSSNGCVLNETLFKKLYRR